ncbi:MAG: hypothetical protein WKF34_07140 [Pyrinomonadaceae bacterium]
MSKTVEEAFEIFLSRLAPLRSEQEKAKSHKGSVKSCLRNNFRCYSLFETGSIKNGTGVRHFSDTDYFAVLPQEIIRPNSIVQLRKLKEALQNTFRQTAHRIRVASPSVTVPFGKYRSENLEVTPCVAHGLMDTGLGRRKTYAIADGSGKWMYSSPQAHKDYVAYHDHRLGRKLRPLIKLVKAWKFFCKVPVSSFYLEIRITKLFTNRQSINYPRDLYSVLNSISKNELARIRDPMGISGLVDACPSQQKLETALSRLATAVTRADKALYYHDRDPKKAFKYWNLLFSGNFPAQ